MDGAVSVRKGKIAERGVARYLTLNGIPARREVRTGNSQHADEGDVSPDGLCIEVKNWTGDLTIGSVVTLLAKLETQRQSTEFGWLVDRLDRIADPGKWACWMSAQGAYALLHGAKNESIRALREMLPYDLIMPIRFQFSDAVKLFRQRGWASVVVNPFETE